MSQPTTVHTGGIGFLGLLTVALVVLKLLGKITLSWWLVFTPVLVVPAFLLTIIVVALVMAGIVTLFK